MADTKKDSSAAADNGAKETQAIPDTAFAAIEKEFQDVLQELMGDRSLEKFRLEYEKLHKALKKSHESEKRLMQKCRELNAEIVANSAKVATALKLSQEDQSTIASLKKEIEKAWKMVDAAHEKETRARDTIQSLKQEISNLTKLVEQGSGLTQGQESSVNELLKVKEELSRERDDLLAEVVKLRELNAEAQVKQQQQDQQQQDMFSKIQELKQDILVKDNEAQREARRKDKLERDLRQAKSDLDAKSGEARQLQAQIEKYKADIQRTEQSLKEAKVMNERAVKDMEVLQQRQQKAQSDLEAQMINVAQLNTENQNKATELKQKEDDVNQLKQDITKLTKMQENIQRKLQTSNQQRTDIEKNRDDIKNQISSLEKELEAKKKQTEQDKKAIDELTRERDILNKSLLKAAGHTQKQMNLVKLHEQSKKNLEQEITNYKEEAQKQRKIIFQLEKERDKYINEASDLTQKVLQHMEDIKVREMQIFDYKKKIAEAETKLKQQQNLYEAVRSDRNLYSKNLIESQDEITEMKRKLKIMNHQIDQLKDEISTKEAALVKERLEHDRVEKEKEALKAELQEMKQQADKDKTKIDALDAEAEKLQKVIKEADAEKLRQKKELDQVISQRDILGAQLVNRNSELALLYEKIKIQQSTLNKGETQYNQRMEDIRILKLEIRKIRREKAILQKTVANVDDLRREVYHLQRELLRERTRCKALEEELENPMNIHRWRKLEGSDPSTYEMIQKIHMLQKRLIGKTEEVVEKELLIQEKEKLYIELKHILARQPGPEVAEQLAIYQQTLREKTKQLKAMSSELNMYESQVNENKYEMERLARELQEVKKKYFMQKKKEQQTREKDKALQQAGQPPILPQRTDQSRFTGGGFNLRQPAGKVIS